MFLNFLLGHEVPGDPGRVEESLPVGLVMHGVPLQPLPGHRLAKELARHLLREVVLKSKFGSGKSWILNGPSFWASTAPLASSSMTEWMAISTCIDSHSSPHRLTLQEWLLTKTGLNSCAASTCSLKTVRCCSTMASLSAAPGSVGTENLKREPH